MVLRQYRNMNSRATVSYTHLCKDYRKGKNNLLPLIRRSYRKYPKFVEALANRHINYNRTLDELGVMEKEGRILVIRPSSPVTIGRLEKRCV